MTEILESSLTIKFIDVGGLHIRTLSCGHGPAILCLHGAALGSSADVFKPALKIFANAGFTAIAYDQPGYGRSDPPAAEQLQNIFATEVMAALGIDRAVLVGHSRAGNQAIQLAFKSPELVSHVVVLGTGSLLPPLDGGDHDEAVEQQLQERQQAGAEPSVADTRKLLEADLFHHDLITDQLLQTRHDFSTGRNFTAFAARQQAGISNKKAKNKPAIPVWDRLAELPVPLLMIYGKQDRADAGARAELLKARQPNLNLHLIDGCKHLVPIDATDRFTALTISFLKSTS